MMRDDFTLFDSYAFSGPAAPFGTDVRGYFASEDKRVKEKHMEGWRAFATGSFALEQVDGNHLFFFDVPARAKYMQHVVSRLPF